MRPTFLVDGFVAGTWKAVKKTGAQRLDLEPLGPLPEREREALDGEGERLLGFLTGSQDAA